MKKIPMFLTVFLAYSVLTILNAAPDLVPMPKSYEQTGGNFICDNKTIYIEKGNRQCEIAADEIVKKIKELSGTPGEVKAVGKTSDSGIYILPCSNSSAQSLIKEFSLKITAEDPGPQGYIIHTSPERLIIIGSDNIGTLYGAMTFCQMLEKSVKNGVQIISADVYDKPDYRYRSEMSFDRGLEHWATGEKDKTEAYKAGIDTLMRFKVNMINDYHTLFAKMDIRTVSPETKRFIKEINQYAIDRGIYPGTWLNTNIATEGVDKGIDFENWDCIRYRKKGLLYCWSRDKIAEKKINECMELLKECNFRFLFLHPIDGGGIEDPELWSHRCKQCKGKWKDDERWKASIHQYNIWADVLKKKCPEIMFVSPIYPYAATYGSIDRFPGVNKNTWKQNSVDYWTKVNKGLDPVIIPQSWIAQRGLMDKYRQHFKGRSLAIYSHSFVPLGYFGTWHRFNKTNYYGNPNDIFTLNGGCDRYEKWLNVICDCEYTWNTNAPGSEYFTGLYYDAEKDHTEPKEIIDEWVPRACRALYGKELGEKIAPIYQAGVQNLYIMDPGHGLQLANKQRRKPLAEVDPTKKDEKSEGSVAAPDIEDTASRMALQVKAAEKAMKALENALPNINSMDKYLRKSFMYFYKRMPLWYMTARARYACYVASDLQRDGMYESAAGVLEAGLKSFEKDYAHAHKILESVKDEPDLNKAGLFAKRGGDIKPAPEEVRKMLNDQLESSKVVLKPRRPGPSVMVGIYKGLGAEGTKAFLDQFKNVKTDIIDSLTLSVLDRYDCIFIMQTSSVKKDDYFFNLPRYVNESGGGVIFQHEMCGFGRFAFGQKTPFPEISPCASGRKDALEVIMEKENPVLPDMKKGANTTHMYYDHIIPKVGENGFAVVVDKDKEPIVVAGTSGYGKVVFDGNVNITKDDKESTLTDFNAAIAKGAVEWMTGVKLKKK
ncbi:MAG: hypothetical protein A2017_03960 [Lentisphaerae bacterium GWF2_44_16]|nr:MAG: hypothetical protein A2017_03960 [Lentisphaerae bacterium GWF2_44_16]